MFSITSTILRGWKLGALFILALSIVSPALAGRVVLGGGGGEYSVKVKTLSDRRFTQVVHQKYDFSCGSAAVATLLTYHYGNPVTEIDVLNAMYEHGDQEKIKREGFSLLDMKNYLNLIGYQAEGYKESLDKLTSVDIPAIALINRRGYLHFVVIKGVTKDKVSLGDPTLGVIMHDREDFEKMWNGVLFVILDRIRTASATFNSEAAWKPYGIPQFRNMLDTGQLSSVTLSTAYSPGHF